MKTFLCWLKFNAVGAVGFVLQLTSLAILHRLLGTHYLWASAAATEITLLHNFTWHLHFTWRDRRDADSTFARFVRFHLSNGVVSMAGNLVLVRLFVQHAHLPVVLANVIAILCCSLLNFYLGNVWAFRTAQPPQPSPATRTARTQPLDASLF